MIYCAKYGKSCGKLLFTGSEDLRGVLRIGWLLNCEAYVNIGIWKG